MRPDAPGAGPDNSPEAQARDRQATLRRAFGTPDGRRAMTYIAAMAGFSDGAQPIDAQNRHDPVAMAFGAGARSLFLHILHEAGMTVSFDSAPFPADLPTETETA